MSGDRGRANVISARIGAEDANTITVKIKARVKKRLWRRHRRLFEALLVAMQEHPSGRPRGR